MDNKITLEKANNSNGHKSSRRQRRRQKGRPESEANRVADLMDKVFKIDSIRERIIEHVIEDADPEEVAALRLVQKVWLRDVSKMLLKSRRPLYRLTLHEENSLNSSNFVSYYVLVHKQKILDRFISTVLSPSRIENSTLPFFLRIMEEFFHDENHTSFANFLTGGGTLGLVVLDMLIPKNGGSMDFVFPQRTLYFPILKVLSIKFSAEDATKVGRGLHSDPVFHGSTTNFIPFIQSILHGSSQLKDFSVSGRKSQVVLPNGIRYLTLPASLTTLYFDCWLTTRQLEELAANSLPNLTHLTLSINNIPFSNGLLFRVLDQYKKTLQKLNVHGFDYEEEDIPRDATYFRFPVMESLTHFTSVSIHAELEADLSNLPTFLPKLEDLVLREQTVGMFRKWTEGSCFPTVTKLKVGLVDENFCDDSKHHHLTFRFEEMQLLHMAFPNVTVLELGVTAEEAACLKYVFTEMKQLTHLFIIIMNSFQPTNTRYWDSLLIGVPPHVDKKPKDGSPSIRNLTELSTLCLCAKFPRGLGVLELEEEKSLISDSVFNKALLKMPNLKALVLFGRFKVSAKMRRLWESEQRFIRYSDDVEFNYC